MAEPLKNIYNPSFFNRLHHAMEKVLKNHDRKSFERDVFDSAWESRELKQRMTHLTEVLHPRLDSNYEKAVDQLIALCNVLNIHDNGLSFEFMFLPEYLAKYGTGNYGASMAAMEHITRFTSCEFAIRPFLNAEPKITMDHLLQLTGHPHETVRRFASEGCRPRLPWAPGVPFLKKDPSLIFPILENLKDDPSEFVRRSVANNFNDISKDHPEAMIKRMKAWHGKSVERNKLVKHACRTLLKQGHPEALSLFGLASNKNLQLKSFQLESKKVTVGKNLNYSLELLNSGTDSAKFRLEYVIYFQLANGSFGRKVFKISEGNIEGGSSITFQRKHSFRPITTRRYYPGEHRISMVVNGTEQSPSTFMLSL